MEPALVDAFAHGATPALGVGLVLQVLGDRRTTPERLDLAVRAARPNLPGASVLAALVADARCGVASRLELEYVRGVHRPHALPEARFNAVDQVQGRRVYRDVAYPDGLVVELDGLAFHGPATACWDRLRDNDLVLRGGRTLRFGWPEVTGTPCQAASMVLAGLGGRWRGRPCGPSCPVR